MRFPDNPKVSYLLSVHNGAATLPETLNSLLNQNGINLEIIAVNDGSTDESLKILKKFASRCSQIKIFSLPHLGLSISRNFAFSKSTAGYIASASQDDIYLPQKTLNQINFLQQKNLDFCFTRVDLIDFKGQPFSHYEKEIDNARLWPHPFDIVQILLVMDVCSPTFLCLRRCYQQTLWHPGLMIFADKYLWLKLFLRFRGGKLPQVSLLRRYPAESKIRQVKNQYPLPFLYLEHRAAMLAALIYRVFPPDLIPPVNDFFSTVKCLMKLEQNNFDMLSYRQLFRIYRKLNFLYPSVRLRHILKEIPKLLTVK